MEGCSQGGVVEGEENKGSHATEFFIDTGGHCFFCLCKVPQEKGGKGVEGNGENSVEGEDAVVSQIKITSFQYLFKYLKLDREEIFRVPRRLLKKVFKSNLIVESCDDCFEKNEKFAEIYSQLEKIEMEAQCQMTVIHNKMLEAENVGRFQKLRGLFEATTKTKPRVKTKIVERFWLETLSKCRDKLNERLPKISLKHVSKKPKHVAPSSSKLPNNQQQVKNSTSKGPGRPRKYLSKITQNSQTSSSNEKEREDAAATSPRRKRGRPRKGINGIRHFGVSSTTLTAVRELRSRQTNDFRNRLRKIKQNSSVFKISRNRRKIKIPSIPSHLIVKNSKRISLPPNFYGLRNSIKKVRKRRDSVPAVKVDKQKPLIVPFKSDATPSPSIVPKKRGRPRKSVEQIQPSKVEVKDRKLGANSSLVLSSKTEVADEKEDMSLSQDNNRKRKRGRKPWKNIREQTETNENDATEDRLTSLPSPLLPNVGKRRKLQIMNAPVNSSSTTRLFRLSQLKAAMTDESNQNIDIEENVLNSSPTQPKFKSKIPVPILPSPPSTSTSLKMTPPIPSENKSPIRKKRGRPQIISDEQKTCPHCKVLFPSRHRLGAHITVHSKKPRAGMQKSIRSTVRVHSLPIPSPECSSLSPRATSSAKIVLPYEKTAPETAIESSMAATSGYQIISPPGARRPIQLSQQKFGNEKCKNSTNSASAEANSSANGVQPTSVKIVPESIRQPPRIGCSRIGIKLRRYKNIVRSEIPTIVFPRHQRIIPTRSRSPRATTSSNTVLPGYENIVPEKQSPSARTPTSDKRVLPSRGLSCPNPDTRIVSSGFTPPETSQPSQLSSANSENEASENSASVPTPPPELNCQEPNNVQVISIEEVDIPFIDLTSEEL